MAKKHGKGYIKAIVTGHVIEIYEYEKMPVLPGNKKQEDNNVELEGNKSDFELLNKEKNRRVNMQRARNRLRRLITANFDEGSKFVTLTFKEDLKDVKTANKHFKRFIQRLRYRYKGFKYAAVIEFTKKGRVHYHMISDLPYIENDELAGIWTHGFVKINKITHVDNVGAYMIKYMTKDSEDTRLQGLKSYQTSRGLTRPLEYVGDSVEEILSFYSLKDKKTAFSSSYKTEHLGTVNYNEYNLKRL